MGVLNIVLVLYTVRILGRVGQSIRMPPNSAVWPNTDSFWIEWSSGLNGHAVVLPLATLRLSSSCICKHHHFISLVHRDNAMLINTQVHPVVGRLNDCVIASSLWQIDY